jgi:hypothetical protein
VKSDRQERPTIRKIVDVLNGIDIEKLPLAYEVLIDMRTFVKK